MKLRVEAMATFWIGDNPERASSAADVVQKLYQDLRPQTMIRVQQGGILYLGWVTELEDPDGIVS